MMRNDEKCKYIIVFAQTIQHVKGSWFSFVIFSAYYHMDGLVQERCNSSASAM